MYHLILPIIYIMINKKNMRQKGTILRVLLMSLESFLQFHSKLFYDITEVPYLS